MGVTAIITDHGVDLAIDAGAGRSRKDATLKKRAGKTNSRPIDIAVTSNFAGSANARRKARAMGRQASHPAQSCGNTVIGCCPQPANL